MIATHEFATAGRVQAAALGRPDIDPVFVTHPVQDRTPEELWAEADRVFDEIVSRLVASG
jgi:hypothetical protein